jgi:uncharacterized protein YeaO (DUF488 family)
MFNEASVRDRKVAFDHPGHRVLVMRRWPRGIPKRAVDTWLREAAPSQELLKAYQEGELSWAVFEARYRQEMLEQRPWVLDELHRLHEQHGSVLLLCQEQIPPDEHCHRLVLIDLLGQTARVV